VPDLSIGLVAALATVGGALGAGLETEDAVRQAAYANRPDTTPPSTSLPGPDRDGDDGTPAAGGDGAKSDG
jgi:hypothetical protein